MDISSHLNCSDIEENGKRKKKENGKIENYSHELDKNNGCEYKINNYIENKLFDDSFDDIFLTNLTSNINDKKIEKFDENFDFITHGFGINGLDNDDNKSILKCEPTLFDGLLISPDKKDKYKLDPIKNIFSNDDIEESEIYDSLFSQFPLESSMLKEEKLYTSLNTAKKVDEIDNSDKILERIENYISHKYLDNINAEIKDIKNEIHHIVTCVKEKCLDVNNCVDIRRVMKHIIECEEKECNKCISYNLKLKNCIEEASLNNKIIDVNNDNLLEKCCNSLINKNIELCKIDKNEDNDNNINRENSQTSKEMTMKTINIVPNLDEIKEIEIPENILKEIFMPVLEELVSSKESVVFLKPVDIVGLNIPDYPEIIRKPMDLGTVRKNLNNNVYKSIWDILYDLLLIFDNACIYNKRSTKIHKSAVKLSGIVSTLMSPIMEKFGYCCDKRYTYSLNMLFCNSKEFCVIPTNVHYYRSSDGNVIFCENCYNDEKSEYLCINRENNKVEKIEKRHLYRERNNIIIEEPMIICVLCKKKYHKICVMHVDIIDGKYFYCQSCRLMYSIPKNINSFMSQNLPETHLSRYIEDNVNNFLRSENKTCNYVHIRLICNVEKIFELKSTFINRLNINTSNTLLNSKFPYRMKALFAFQEHAHDREICFFSMHVQEYGDDCPQPNKRRVYLSYLDSVHYFEPKILKTSLYYEIIGSYLNYCKLNGYWYCHIWSCPPCEGDDYIFHCHSYEQKLPKPRRLLEWYNKFTEVVKSKNIVTSHQDIYDYFKSRNIKDIQLNIPYFEGDYWSSTMEDTISQYDKDLLNYNESLLSHSNRGMDRKNNNIGKVNNGHSVGVRKNKTPTSKTHKKYNQPESTLDERLYNSLEKFREIFFILTLNEPANNVPFISDRNPIMISDLMDGRSGFLSLCRENHWEFSSKRHAFYSTKAMLYNVHQQTYNFSEYTCDVCGAILCMGVHCEKCEGDYDLCNICSDIYKHVHDTIKKVYIDFDELSANILKNIKSSLTDLSSSLIISSNNTTDNETLILYENIIIHTLTCQTPPNISCNVELCDKVKKMINHFNSCVLSNRTLCIPCKKLYEIYNFHSIKCSNNLCQFPCCKRLKGINNQNKIVKHNFRSRMNNMNIAVLEDKPKNTRSITSPQSSSDFEYSPSTIRTNNNGRKDTSIVVSRKSFNNSSSSIGKKDQVMEVKNKPTNSAVVPQIIVNEQSKTREKIQRTANKSSNPVFLQPSSAYVPINGVNQQYNTTSINDQVMDMKNIREYQKQMFNSIQPQSSIYPYPQSVIDSNNIRALNYMQSQQYQNIASAIQPSRSVIPSNQSTRTRGYSRVLCESRQENPSQMQTTIQERPRFAQNQIILNPQYNHQSSNSVNAFHPQVRQYLVYSNRRENNVPQCVNEQQILNPNNAGMIINNQVPTQQMLTDNIVVGSNNQQQQMIIQQVVAAAAADQQQQQLNMMINCNNMNNPMYKIAPGNNQQQHIMMNMPQNSIEEHDNHQQQTNQNIMVNYQNIITANNNNRANMVFNQNQPNVYINPQNFHPNDLQNMSQQQYLASILQQQQQNIIIQQQDANNYHINSHNQQVLTPHQQQTFENYNTNLQQLALQQRYIKNTSTPNDRCTSTVNPHNNQYIASPSNQRQQYIKQQPIINDPNQLNPMMANASRRFYQNGAGYGFQPVIQNNQQQQIIPINGNDQQQLLSSYTSNNVIQHNNMMYNACNNGIPGQQQQFRNINNTTSNLPTNILVDSSGRLYTTTRFNNGDNRYTLPPSTHINEQQQNILTTTNNNYQIHPNNNDIRNITHQQQFITTQNMVNTTNYATVIQPRNPFESNQNYTTSNYRTPNNTNHRR